MKPNQLLHGVGLLLLTVAHCMVFRLNEQCVFYTVISYYLTTWTWAEFILITKYAALARSLEIPWDSWGQVPQCWPPLCRKSPIVDVKSYFKTNHLQAMIRSDTVFMMFHWDFNVGLYALTFEVFFLLNKRTKHRYMTHSSCVVMLCSVCTRPPGAGWAQRTMSRRKENTRITTFNSQKGHT